MVHCTIINSKYTHRKVIFLRYYHGGLVKYIEDFQKAYAELDVIAEVRARETGTLASYIPHHLRLEQLSSRLYVDNGARGIFQAINRKNLLYTAAVQELQSEVLKIRFAHGNTAQQKVVDDK